MAAAEEVGDRQNIMQLDNKTISDLIEGQINIGLAYDELFKSASQVGDGPVSSASARGKMYNLEIGSVFTAGQLLGYSHGMKSQIDYSGVGPLMQSQVITCSEGMMDIQSPALKAIGLANSETFINQFPIPPVQSELLAGWQTMYNLIKSYYCRRMSDGSVGETVKGENPGTVNVKVPLTMNIPDEELSELGSQIALLDTVAMSGYQFGLSDGISAANNAFAGASACESRGGRKKKGAGARKKRVMRGGDILSRPAKLNLLTIAVILGGGYASYIAGAGGSVLAGFDFCYRQGRSILYALNWLKRPCTTDAAIISGLLFKSIPGFGAGAKTCLEIARWNKIMNTALIGVAGSVYSTAIALGMKVITGSTLTSMPYTVFTMIKTKVSEPVLNILESIATYLQPRAIETFQAIANGAGNASEAVRSLAATIVNALTTSTCPPSDPNTSAVAELAAAELGAQDASDEIASNANAITTAAGVDQSPPAPQPQASVTPEQQEALDTILSAMDPENRAAFVELVKIGTALRRAQRKLTEIMALSDDAQKVAAFNSENTEMQKKIIGLMNEAQRTMLTNGGVDTAALLAGGRKRKTRRRRVKKRKTKTMRKKKTRGRKVKRKTKGKKSKVRRKTRNYRR